MAMMSGKRPALAGVLFDKDGTLVDFDRTWLPIIHRATAHAAGGDAGLTARLLALGGLDTATGKTRADSLFAASNTVEIVDAFIAAGAPQERRRLAETFDAIFAEASREAVPIGDTRSVFLALRARGIKIGIASSDNAASIGVTVDVLGVADLVDFIAGYDSGHGAKPDPGMVQAFCHAIGATPRAVAMVGDNRHDMAMAAAAGCGLKIAVLSGTGSRETLADHADICMKSIAELPACLGIGQEGSDFSPYWGDPGDADEAG